MLTLHRPAVNRFFAPVAARIARAGIPPAALTLAAPLLTTAACAWFLRARAAVPFCVVMLFVGLLDVLDGAVARAAGRVTKFGAYLDALCDRYVDALVALSAAAVTGYWAPCMIALVGALLVSYAKARAGMEVPVSNVEWPDLMERGERSALFLAGLAAGSLAPWRPLGRDLFWWTAAGLAALIHVTVVQRVLRARRLIRLRGGGA